MARLQRVVVVGASRGIGQALAEELARHGTVVIPTVRVRANGVWSIIVDMADPDAGSAIEAEVRRGELDAIVINAGIFGPEHQDVARIDRSEVADLFWTNAVAPVRLARRLLPLVRAGGVIALMSSRTASIGLNTDGDMEIYRASKAALNALSRSLAIKDALPSGVGVLLLHPGWVKTDMGGSNAPVEVADSVAGLRTVIEAGLDQPAHRFIDYQGNELTW